MLTPTFALTIGDIQATTARPVGGPTRFVVERDMDIPADALRLQLMQRTGVRLNDPVRLELGADSGQPARTTTVFTGSVVALRPTLYGTEVHALGSLHALLNHYLVRTFQTQTVGAIVRTLVTDAGLQPGTIENGPTLPRYAIDRRLNVFAHIKALAERLGHELYADVQGRVRLHTPLTTAAATTYTAGTNLLAAVGQQHLAAWSAVAVGGESPMSARGERTAYWLTIDSVGSQGMAGRGTPHLLVLDPTARTRDLAQQFARGYLQRTQRQAYQLQLTVAGSAALELGDLVIVRNAADDLLNGRGYIRAIQHTFSASVGFVTRLRLAL